MLVILDAIASVMTLLKWCETARMSRCSGSVARYKSLEPISLTAFFLVVNVSWTFHFETNRNQSPLYPIQWRQCCNSMCRHLTFLRSMATKGIIAKRILFLPFGLDRKTDMSPRHVTKAPFVTFGVREICDLTKVFVNLLNHIHSLQMPRQLSCLDSCWFLSNTFWSRKECRYCLDVN